MTTHTHAPAPPRKGASFTRRTVAFGASLAVLGGALLCAGPANAAPANWNPAPSYTTSDNGDGTYKVPLLNSDVPDVSVTMVPTAENTEGRDIYYMISTTMHLSPGAPIMKSYDLINWDIVNYAAERISIDDNFSLRNGQSSYGEGQWASSLRYHDGMYYAVFNTNNLGGVYIYRTDDIEHGTWQVNKLGTGLHDLSLFFDDANGGTPYIISGGGQTDLVQLDHDLTKIVKSYPKVLSKADFPNDSFVTNAYEGQQLFYIDGMYYIASITWPAGGDRQVTLFRSPELLGHYASADGENTWETHDAKMGDAFAQGSLVPITQPDGSTTWYGYFFRDTYPTGRIPALIPATWKDGWPTFGTGGPVRVNDSFDKPIQLSPADELYETQKSIVKSDDFDNDAEHMSFRDQTHEIPDHPDFDTSKLGIELLTNPGFEDDLGGWKKNGAATLIADDTDAASGDSSVRITTRKATGDGPAQTITTLQPGATYDITAKVKYDDGPAAKNFFVSAMLPDKIINVASGTAKKGQWSELKGTYTVPLTQDVSSATLFVETPWMPSPDAVNDLMDFSVDDVSVIGKQLDTEYASPDEFAYNGSDLDLAWEWNHAPDNRDWSLTDRDGWLRLTNGHTVTGEARYLKGDKAQLTYFEEARNTLSQRTWGPKASAETRMDISHMQDGDVAGLALYTRSFSYIGVQHKDGQNTLGLVTRPQPFQATFDADQVESFVSGTTVDLGENTDVSVKADWDTQTHPGQGWVQYSYSLDGETWQNLGAPQGPLAQDWSLSHFMGYRFGLFNYAKQSTGGYVDFDYYDLSDKLGVASADVDLSQLDAAISYGQSLSEANYPADVWADMQDVLAKAVSAREAGPVTQNQADAPERALSLQLARLGTLVSDEAPSPLSLSATTRCVAGKIVVVGTAKNESDEPLTVSFSSDFGAKQNVSLAAGKSASASFSSRLASVPAGAVTVTAGDAEASAEYTAASCR